MKAIEKYKATLMLLVPPVALALATGKHTSVTTSFAAADAEVFFLSDPAIDKYDLSSLKYLLSGAAPLGPELQRRLQKRLKCYVTQAYGMTES